MRKRVVNVIRGVSGKAVLLVCVFISGAVAADFLREQKRSEEIEARSRAVTAIIKYIKSRGYRGVLENVSWDNGRFSAEYHIERAGKGEGYVIDRSMVKGYIKNNLFGKILYKRGSVRGGTLCFMDRSGIDLGGTTLEVDMKKTTISFDPPGASGEKEKAAGPEKSSNATEGAGYDAPERRRGREVIFGRVILTGTSNSRAVEEEDGELPGRNFIIIPKKKYS